LLQTINDLLGGILIEDFTKVILIENGERLAGCFMEFVDLSLGIFQFFAVRPNRRFGWPGLFDYEHLLFAPDIFGGQNRVQSHPLKQVAQVNIGVIVPALIVSANHNPTKAVEP